MQFELTKALLEDILFSMEDQEIEFLIDTLEGVVVGGIDDDGVFDDEGEESDSDDYDDESRFISLPEWDSSDGFRLMEHFAAGLRNPLVREELSSALGRGRGVFRAFKDALARHPEVEKLWFSYKDREMKRAILRWYNGLREEWGLEKIGMEPDETEDLVLEDFRFRPFQNEDMPQAEELHQCCLEEGEKTLAETGAPFFAGIFSKEAGEGLNASSLSLIAESGGGDFAGYISGTIKDAALHIQRLEVKAEYRGLGIGETLLTRFLDSLDANKINWVLLDLPSWAEGFSRVLLRECFKPYSVRYCLSLKDRAD